MIFLVTVPRFSKRRLSAKQETVQPDTPHCLELPAIVDPLAFRPPWNLSTAPWRTARRRRLKRPCEAKPASLGHLSGPWPSCPF